MHEMMWSLVSPRTKRISGPEKFRSPPQKDFFNKIDPKRTPDSVIDLDPIILADPLKEKKLTIDRGIICEEVSNSRLELMPLSDIQR